MTLSKHCIPRKSVFDEYYVTAGMKLLVEKSFDRLLGRRDQAAA